MKKVIFITYDHPPQDVRLYHKLGLSLSTRYEVLILSGIATDDIAGNPRIIALHCRSKGEFLRKAFFCSRQLAADIVILVEPFTLLLAPVFRFFGKTRVFYDCHEFYALTFAYKKQFSSVLFFLYREAEGLLAKFCEGIFAVNKFHKIYLQSYHRHVYEVPNLPLAKIAQPCEELQYDVIYTGVIAFDRGLKKIVKAIAILAERGVKPRMLFLGRFETKAEAAYFAEITKDGLVHIDYLPSLPYNKALSYTASAKIGICLLNPCVISYKYAVALKLLEYINHNLFVITNKFLILREINYPRLQAIEYSSQQLAEAILLGLAAPEPRLDMRYAWETFQEQFLEIFTEK